MEIICPVNLIKNADKVRYVKSKRMAWLSHVMRMEGERIPKRVLEWKPMGRRNREGQRKDGLRTLKKIYRYGNKRVEKIV
jgi:hypothetical protein